jgi:CRP-like cAMP-binding protein
MVNIFIENVRPGMKVDNDIYSRSGVKLLARGSILTLPQIQMLRKHEIREIAVDDRFAVDIEDPFEWKKKNIAVLPGRDRKPTLNDIRKQSNERSPLKSIIEQIPLFADFNNEHLKLLECSVRKEKHEAQTVLFHEGDPGNSFFAISQGSIKVYTKSKDGEEKILSVLKAGDNFGELALIDGKPRSASAQTLEASELIVIERDHFMEILRSNFDIALAVMTELTQRMRDANQHVADLTFYDERTRVIKSLIKLANSFGQRTDRSIVVKMPLEIKELAQMAGVKPGEVKEVLFDLGEKQLLRMHASHFELNLSMLGTAMR